MTPREFAFTFRKERACNKHYAMLGMGTVLEGQPMYAEAMNEKGLCIAGLNFPKSAFYPADQSEGKANITPFELPWWLLGQCGNITEARALLAKTHVLGIPFSKETPLSPLHWHIADKQGAIVLECRQDGMHIHDDPVGVVTNEPPFDFHLHNLAQYMNLTPFWPENRFSTKIDLQPSGRGMGAVGLPGDASPASRYVRAAFLKLNSVCDETEEASVAQFMHVLDAVAMPRGSVIAPGNRWETTLYSCCMNAERGIYYYKTYGNNQLTAVNMHRTDLGGRALCCFPLEEKQRIHYAN